MFTRFIYLFFIIKTKNFDESAFTYSELMKKIERDQLEIFVDDSETCLFFYFM